MTGAGAEAVEVGRHAAPLRVRLRVDTAIWHDRVEAVADVPGSIHTRREYVELLSRLFELHSSLECDLASPRFVDAWCSVGVDFSVHRRANLLAVDLMGMGAPTPADSLGTAPFETFGHALGCLYVLEGSSLGGRTVARMVRAAVGEVPTTFLNGDGRPRPSAWLKVCNALTRFEARGGDGDAVVAGACDAFAAFAAHLDPGHSERTGR